MSLKLVPPFEPGPRLIDGAELDLMVARINYLFFFAGTPSNGTSGTGAGSVPPGALLIDTVGKGTYQNTGTVLSPTWTIFETGAAGSPGGANTNVQFNNSGAFGGSANFTWDGSTVTLPALAALNNATLGRSGTIAGQATFVSPTAAKGSLVVKAADSAGATLTTIINASQAAARTYTIPDAGASGSIANSGGGAANAVACTGTGGTSTATMTTLGALVTTAALTTASAASHIITITYTGVTANDLVFVQPSGGGTNAREGQVVRAICSANTITVTIYNANAAAVNGTIGLNVLVVKA